MPIKAKTEKECRKKEIEHLIHEKGYEPRRAVAASYHICGEHFGNKAEINYGKKGKKKKSTSKK